MMQELTREEWERIAAILGEDAKDLEVSAEVIEKDLADDEYEENREYVMMQVAALRKRAEALRIAVGAVLWVAQNAAERCRFEMLDAHPLDQDQGMQDNRYDRKGEDHHEGL